MPCTSTKPDPLAYKVASVTDLLKPGDRYFTFNLHAANQLLKCFDAQGNLLWTAEAAKSPMCGPLAFPANSQLGSLNVLRTGAEDGVEARRRSVWCVPCGETGNPLLPNPGNADVDLRFTERGLRVGEWARDVTERKLSVYELDTEDFARFRQAVLAGTCYLTPHYFQTCSSASMLGSWRPWRQHIRNRSSYGN
ncbi:MAG: hypothetical protein JNL98_24710 [Bryobacterales bacterium]|nr:hypothetical protein [Bryobacterales bacterium]